MAERNATHKREWIVQMLEQHEGSLIGYARRLTGNVETAREVVQEAFLKLCHQSPAELDGKLPQWLFTVCRNKALDIRRKQDRMKPLTAEQLDSCESVGGNPETLAVGKESHSQVVEAVTRLPAAQQEVIRLRFQEKMSYKQIGEVTGKSVSNVGYLIHSAISTIREHMNVSGRAG